MNILFERKFYFMIFKTTRPSDTVDLRVKICRSQRDEKESNFTTFFAIANACYTQDFHRAMNKQSEDYCFERESRISSSN